MELLGDGSIRRLHLDLEQVNSAFAVSGDARAALRPEQGAPEETFIDLYAALATAPPSAVACCKQSNTYGTADRRVKDAGKGCRQAGSELSGRGAGRAGPQISQEKQAFAASRSTRSDPRRVSTQPPTEGLSLPPIRREGAVRPLVPARSLRSLDLSAGGRRPDLETDCHRARHHPFGAQHAGGLRAHP